MTVVSPEPAALSSEELAVQARKGCPDAFESLVERHEQRVFHYLCQLVGNRNDAEDLTQLTFIKAYRGLSHYDPDFGFATWLFTIAKRTAATFHRRPRPDLLALRETNVDENDPAVMLDRKDRDHALWDIARTLKPNQYEALWLRYGEGFSVGEIAGIMRITPIHVKVLLFRARRQLGKNLEQSNWAR